MPLYLISYDVRSKNHDYTRLYACLRQWNAAHLQNSVWLASLTGDAAVVRDVLANHLHNDDTICVVQIFSNSDWATKYAKPLGVSWLKSNVTV